MAGYQSAWFDDELFQIFVCRYPKASVVDIEKTWNTSPHREIELKYFVEGTTTLRIGEKTITARAGDLVMIHPYEAHATIGYEGNSPSKYHLIMVSPDFFGGMGPGVPDLHSLFARGTRFNTLIQRNQQIMYIIENIIDEFIEKKEGYRYTIRGLLLVLFSLLLRDSIHSEESPFSQEKSAHYFNLVAPAINKIRNEYAKEISIEELANLCGVSPCYFCRIFKQVTGVTTLQYIIAYRLKVADAMLSNSDVSITKIANECGFEDVSYFCRCYKKLYHQSPGKKRQEFSKLQKAKRTLCE